VAGRQSWQTASRLLLLLLLLRRRWRVRRLIGRRRRARRLELRWRVRRLIGRLRRARRLELAVAGAAADRPTAAGAPAGIAAAGVAAGRLAAAGAPAGIAVAGAAADRRLRRARRLELRRRVWRLVGWLRLVRLLKLPRTLLELLRFRHNGGTRPGKPRVAVRPDGARPFCGDSWPTGGLFGVAVPEAKRSRRCNPARLGASRGDLPPESGEAAGRLARHEPQAAYSALVRPVDSEARPAMPVGAFAGPAPPAFRSAPATACRSRRATRGRAATDAMLPAGRGAPWSRAGPGLPGANGKRCWAERKAGGAGPAKAPTGIAGARFRIHRAHQRRISACGSCLAKRPAASPDFRRASRPWRRQAWPDYTAWSASASGTATTEQTARRPAIPAKRTRSIRAERQPAVTGLVPPLCRNRNSSNRVRGNFKQPHQPQPAYQPPHPPPQFQPARPRSRPISRRTRHRNSSRRARRSQPTSRHTRRRNSSRAPAAVGLSAAAPATAIPAGAPAAVGLSAAAPATAIPAGAPAAVGLSAAAPPPPPQQQQQKQKPTCGLPGLPPCH